MILDSFKLHNVIIQLQYEDAFELWDCAGAICRQLCAIWPGLEVNEGRPKVQTLSGKGVTLQTGFNWSTITLTGTKSFDQHKVQQAKETFEVWRNLLKLSQVNRISTRATYVREFSSIEEANAEVLGLNLIRWPTTKVFDQPADSELNGPDILYRFEDESSFSTLRLRAERIKFEVDLDPEFTDEPEIRKTKNRMIIEFDRGVLGTVNAEKFRMDDWIKGYQHVLRRDIEKVIKVKS